MVVGIDCINFELCNVLGLLEALVTVISDGCEVNVKVTKHGDLVLFKEGLGTTFGSFDSLALGFGFKGSHSIFDILNDVGVCFEGRGVSVNDDFDNLVEGEGLLSVDPLQDFFIEVMAILVKDGGHGCLHHLSTGEEVCLPVFCSNFNMVDLKAV